MNIILLKDLSDGCADAVIIAEISTAKDIDLAIKKMKENTLYPEWDDYVNCLPMDCVVCDKWGSLEEVYY